MSFSMLDAGRLDRRFRPREPTWTGRVCAAPIGGSPSARMPDGPRPRLGRGPSPGYIFLTAARAGT
ncbi:hypothetical protein BURPS1106B_A2098 [Burkholderia pseudomallei 1106b]|uniref:Uncharacterized protein n=1 Tax=Burkholderia pseudomallei (strain 1106a) TaxID=357348 RepID=A3NXQ4_BURP0|nr:hypothetical protein BURPS1106A_2879 [Burkholderia pseudomallei 1106a]AFR16773.1 hypothetical protein BPC006_I2920 [Burkholderia pseudomallei BPC006]EES26454.1 hypothetical protein BURPS1106B_A2098 [Burkholderia pseudomallei 1106b]